MDKYKQYMNNSEYEFIPYNSNKKFASGGNVDPSMANSQLEKEENVLLPNGTTRQYDLPSHEQQSPEDGTFLPPMTKVFSDKLKTLNGKTFAKAAKPFNTEKEEKILKDAKSNALAKKTAELMFGKKNQELDKLFAEQEQLKFNKVQKYAAKHGIDMGDNKMRNGGLKQYEKGALVGPYSANYYDSNYQEPLPTPFLNNRSSQGMQTIPSINTLNQTVPEGTINTNIQAPNQLPVTGESNPFAGLQMADNIGTAIGTANQLIGPAADLISSGFGKKYDKVNYGQVAPNLLNPTEALNDIHRQTINTARAIPGMTGGHGGQAINALIQNNVQGQYNSAKTRENYDNANAGIKNQMGQYNKGLQIQGMQDEAANKGASRQIARQAAYNIGDIGAGTVGDVKAGQMDENRMKLINSYFPNYKFDPKTYEFYYNAAQKQAGKKPVNKKENFNISK